MAVAEVGADTPDPPGGEIARVDGNPTGLLKETAAALVHRHLPGPDTEGRADALRASWPEAWRAGITSCHDMGVGQAAAFRDLATARDRGNLGLRFVWYAPEGAFDEAVALGLRSGLGDAWLRFGGLKLYLDGTLGAQTARLLQPYDTDPDNTGLALLGEEELGKLVRRAREAGMAVAAHAIGDAAVRLALDHLGGRATAYGSGLVDRIEHAQLVDPADLPRFAGAGVVASCQPSHAVADAAVAERHWGARCHRAYPWRDLRDAGARLAFGSDAPVEAPSVMSGLWAAVTRGGWNRHQALTVGEALQAYTAIPAQITGQGDLLGTLSPGKLADLVVLDADPFAIEPDELRRLEVLGTMIGGAWAWRAHNLDAAGPTFTGVGAA
jgi:predicted amidohydrolase YtcJ